MVLQISQREGEDSGNTEAYGATADCHTELGDLERAGKFYDGTSQGWSQIDASLSLPTPVLRLLSRLKS